MAPLCKFWARGNCRNGDSCRFDHPRDLRGDTNRAATFQAPDSNLPGNNEVTRADYVLNRDLILADLSKERPQWILSAYAPGVKAPAQLFGGPAREQSFEEMRLHHYNGAQSGNPALAIQQANALVQEAESQMQTAINDVDGAIKFIINAENEHPNRVDICKASTSLPSPTGTRSVNPLGGNFRASTPAMTTFGQPSQPGTSSNPFNPPNQAFGQPSMPGPAGMFGRISALGQRPNPFVTPSGGTRNEGGNPFSTLGAVSNAFGTTPNPSPANPFNQSTQPRQTPLFSQPAVLAANPFTQTATPTDSFTRSVQPAQQPPFGQPAASAGNHFAKTAAPQNPFGQLVNQPQSNPPNTTTLPNPFTVFAPPVDQNTFQALQQSKQGNQLGGAESQKSNIFGQSSPGTQSSSSNNQPTSLNTSPSIYRSNDVAPPERQFNIAKGREPYRPSTQLQHPAFENYTSLDSNRRLTKFKGKVVDFRDGEVGTRNLDGTWQKIWFPAGPPPYYSATELDGKSYTEETEAAFLHARESGSFNDGVMPLLPPKREWCLWDF